MFINFINDESGATAMEYGVITATLGTAIAVTAWFFGGMLSSMFFSMGDCIAMGFDPECYSVHANDFQGMGEEPAWWPHA
jgi:Flp pilus assembly pilin Flp